MASNERCDEKVERNGMFVPNLRRRKDQGIVEEESLTKEPLKSVMMYFYENIKHISQICQVHKTNLIAYINEIEMIPMLEKIRMVGEVLKIPAEKKCIKSINFEENLLRCLPVYEVHLPKPEDKDGKVEWKRILLIPGYEKLKLVEILLMLPKYPGDPSVELSCLLLRFPTYQHEMKSYDYKGNHDPIQAFIDFFFDSVRNIVSLCEAHKMHMINVIKSMKVIPFKIMLQMENNIRLFLVTKFCMKYCLPRTNAQSCAGLNNQDKRYGYVNKQRELSSISELCPVSLDDQVKMFKILKILPSLSGDRRTEITCKILNTPFPEVAADVSNSGFRYIEIDPKQNQLPTDILDALKRVSKTLPPPKNDKDHIPPEKNKNETMPDGKVVSKRLLEKIKKIRMRRREQMPVTDGSSSNRKENDLDSKTKPISLTTDKNTSAVQIMAEKEMERNLSDSGAFLKANLKQLKEKITNKRKQCKQSAHSRKNTRRMVYDVSAGIVTEPNDRKEPKEDKRNVNSRNTGAISKISSKQQNVKSQGTSVNDIDLLFETYVKHLPGMEEISENSIFELNDNDFKLMCNLVNPDGIEKLVTDEVDSINKQIEEIKKWDLDKEWESLKKSLGFK